MLMLSVPCFHPSELSDVTRNLAKYNVVLLQEILAHVAEVGVDDIALRFRLDRPQERHV